jgi:hypothetical protein
MTKSEAEIAVRRLIGEIDRYLAGLAGAEEGIAAVRAGIAQHVAGTYRASAARQPMCGSFDDALRLARSQGNGALADAIVAAQPFLPWVTYDSYPRELIGHRFPEAHAFASLIGESCAFDAKDFDLGIFLIKPRTLYRDHRHPAPELYVPLTGPHGWRFGTTDPWKSLPANVPVWNEPDRIHATLVNENPFLAIYAWTRDVHHPAIVVPATDWAEIEARL